MTRHSVIEQWRTIEEGTIVDIIELLSLPLWVIRNFRFQLLPSKTVGGKVESVSREVIEFKDFAINRTLEIREICLLNHKNKIVDRYKCRWNVVSGEYIRIVFSL